MQQFTFKEDAYGGAFYLYDDEIKIGEVTFKKKSEKEININHTYVKPEFEGKGYGKKLVDKVIEHAKENNLHYSATCWFAEKLIQAYSKK